MTLTAMPLAPTRFQPAFALGLLLLGSAGAAAAWALVAVALNRQCGWLALLAAADAVVLLRYCRVTPGLPRALLAVAGTALAIVLANWWIAGTQIGVTVGLVPWESIPRLGWSFGWTLTQMANHTLDLAFYGIALLVAGIAGR